MFGCSAVCNQIRHNCAVSVILYGYTGVLYGISQSCGVRFYA